MKQLACGLIVWGALVPAQVPDLDLPVDQRAWVASKIYASIHMFNAHSEGAPGFDLDSEYRAYLKVGMAVRTAVPVYP
jgi:hypothetical protein